MERESSNMSKDDLALAITQVMFKDDVGLKSFNSYQCIRNYFYDLSLEDLSGIASHYGIKPTEIYS